MKKSILALSLIVASTAMAQNFQVVISKEKTNYESSVFNWVDAGVQYTNWVDTGSPYNCLNWTPVSDEQLIDYQQNSTCSQDQTRKKQYIEEDLFSGTTRVAKEETENQTISSNETRTVNVTQEPAYQVGNSFNCSSWIPETNTVFSGTAFEQNRDCSVNMEQKYNHSVSGNKIHSFTNTYIETNVNEKRNSIGIKKHSLIVKSCGYDQQISGTCSNSRIQTSFENIPTGRGWGIMILDPVTFQKKFYNRYDTHAYPNLATDMANVINNANSGDLILIGTYDQPAYINTGFINAMGTHLKADTVFLSNIASVGYPNSDGTNYRSSYAIISYKGGKKITEDKGYRYDDSYISAILPE